MSFFSDIYNSATTEKGGFSARKLTAFVTLVTALIITHEYTNSENLEGVLLILFTFILLCLGLDNNTGIF